MQKNLSPIMDIERVNQLLEDFNKSTGLVTAILDLEGNVLSQSSRRDICTLFHHKHPTTAHNCLISDTELANKMAEGKKYHFYKCLNGLVDVATPIIINREHVANLFTGQFFLEKPDLDFFRKQAKKYGFNKEKYLSALKKVPVISQETAETNLNFLSSMVHLIGELSSQKNKLKESEALFKNIFEKSSIWKSITSISGEIKVNQDFADMLGYSVDELQKFKWQDITPKEEIESIQKLIEPLVAGSKNTVRFEKRYICKDGSLVCADVNTTLQRDENGKPEYFITDVVDITEKKKAKSFNVFEANILELIAKSTELPKILNEIALGIEKQLVGGLSSVLLLNNDGVHVLVGSAPNLPEDFSKVIEGEPIGPRAGSCGTAMFLKKQVIVSDINSNPLWEKYRTIALQNGLKACWSTPIFDSEKNVLGSFAIYYKEPRSPKKEDLALINRIVYLTSIAIERSNIGKELIESNTYNRMLFESSVTGLALTDLKGKLVDINPAYAHIIGRTKEETLKLTYWDITPEKYNEQEKIQLELLDKTLAYGPYEKEYIHKSGHLVPVRLQGKIIELKGEKYIWSTVEDITEQKETEKALLQSEERLRLSTELANVAVWEFDFKTNRMSRSKNHDQLYGLDWQEKWKFETFVNATYPEDREYSNTMIQQSVAVGGADSYKFDFRIVTPENNVRWLEVTGQVVERNEKGEGIIVRGCLIDITDRKQTETALRLSEEKFQNAFQISPVGVTINRISDGKFIEVNDAFLETFEFNRNEVIGQTSLELNMLLPDERKKLIHQQIKTGGLRNFELQFQTKSGKPIYTLFSSRPIEIEGEKCHITIMIDISEQHLAKQKLIENERKFRTLFEQASVGVGIIDTNTGKYVSVNEKQCEIVGYSMEEMLQMDFMAITHPDDLQADLENMEKLKRGEIDKFRMEKRYIRKNGNIVWVVLNVYPLWKKGEQTNFHVAICEDITEKKKADKLILESEERYRSLFENMNAGFVLFKVVQDKNGKTIDLIIVAANSGFEKTTGLDLRSAQGKRLTKVLPGIEKDEADWIGNYSEIVRTGISKQFENYSKLLDTYYSVSAFKAGSNLCAVTFTNVTAAKKTELKLKESEAHFREIYEQSPLAIQYYDADGNLIDVNPASLELFGITDKATIKPFNFWSESNLTAQTAEKLKLGSTVVISSVTDFDLIKELKLFETKKSGKIYINKFISPIISSGKTQNYLVHEVDITETKLATEKLKVNEARFREIYEQSPLAIQYYDADGNLIDVNRATLDLFGISDKATIQPYNFWHTSKLTPEASENLKAGKPVLISSVTDFDLIKEHKLFETSRSGKIFVTMYVAPIMSSDKTVNYLVHLIDVTERHNAEREIKQLNQELEQRVEERTKQLRDVNSELQAFTYSVSHDLKAPLRGIDGYSKLLLELHGKKLEKEPRLFLNNIRQGTLQMNQLINDLLAYSRLERSRLMPKEIKINSLVNEIIEPYKTDVQNQNILFKTRVDAIKISTDLDGLTMALRNIIENAVKFTRHTEKPMIEITTKQTANDITIGVKDNGIGFDMKFQDKIFEIFQRLHRAEDYPGTGIGLALVAKSIRRMGGSVWAESQPGSGAAFYIKIPIKLKIETHEDTLS